MILLIRTVLFTLACTSPLLTLARLWQLKEWRIDRLKEHMRAEGWRNQLVGNLRPLITFVVLAGLQMTHLPSYAKIDAVIAALAVLSVLQILTRRQRYPVWTLKARILVCASVCADIALITLLDNGNWILAVMPMLQSVALLLVWILFLPVDHLLKKRILQKAARLRSMYTRCTTIGITGSVGKTTTKELIAHILSGKNPLFTPAYVNSEMGVAQWMLRELPKRNPEDECIMIVEMGAYRMGEIAQLCKIAQPKIGIVTYVGTQHIALFGSQEKLCKAKGELPASLPRDGVALLNADNQYCNDMRNNCASTVVTVGTGGHADIEAFDIEETGNGVSFRVGSTVFSVPLHGTHNITNILLAIGAARTLGMKDTEIAKALRTFTPPHHTFSVRRVHGITVLDDTHNASPESFRAALAWAKSQPAERTILITPGLIELGQNEDRIHRELGETSTHIDAIIFTQQHGRAAFERGFGSTVHHSVPTEPLLKKGDLLLCIGRIPESIIMKLLSNVR